MDPTRTTLGGDPLAIETTSAESVRWLERATWGFVVLGVLLRVARYALDFPLWWDEAFVGANLLRRGYLDLLQPLDYGQVCPLLFLWVERAAVGCLGFSEWSLRLFPLACGVASVFLFRHVAGRVLKGLPLLLAVAIFATAFHPIRHAADVKPYASDLLAALVLLGLALEWWRRPDEVRWLWALAAVGPITVGWSHPAIFVAGGLGVALLPAVWRSGRGEVWAAWVVFNLAAAGTFAGLYVLFTAAQAEATLPVMRPDWAGSFPPTGSLAALAGWLVSIHAGSMLAYPCGGEGGASAATLILCGVGVWVLVRSGRGTVAALLLGPLGWALVAAAGHRYPYGGSARFMQYLAPAVCLLAGLGAAVVPARIGPERRRARFVRLGLIGLAVVGVVPVAADLAHPYRSMHAQRARDFSRRFWPELTRDAEVACLRWDFGVGAWNTIHLGVPVFLCNQAIDSPARWQGGPRWEAVSEQRPLRCVRFRTPDDGGPEVQDWLKRMQARYELRDRRERVVNMAEPGARPRPERYEVFEFVPRTVSHRSL